MTTKYPSIAANSGPHLNANALTVIGIRNTRADLDAGEDLINSLGLEELRWTLAALATQAAGHCVRSLGGDKDVALEVMQQMGIKLAGLPAPADGAAE